MKFALTYDRETEENCKLAKIIEQNRKSILNIANIQVHNFYNSKQKDCRDIS